MTDTKREGGHTQVVPGHEIAGPTVRRAYRKWKLAAEFYGSGVTVICIQVVAPDGEVLDEEWVNISANGGKSIPDHGSPAPFWHKIGIDARYNVTPFAKLDRTKHVVMAKARRGGKS